MTAAQDLGECKRGGVVRGAVLRIEAGDLEESVDAVELAETERAVLVRRLRPGDELRKADRGGAPVEFGDQFRTRVAGGRPDEHRALEAAAPRVGHPHRQVHSAVAPRVHGGEDPACARPDAVVAGLDSPEEGEQVERTPARIDRRVLHLQAQHVVPLGQIPVVGALHVARERPDLGLREAVDLEATVEELEARRRTGQNHAGDACDADPDAGERTHLPPPCARPRSRAGSLSLRSCLRPGGLSGCRRWEENQAKSARRTGSRCGPHLPGCASKTPAQGVWHFEQRPWLSRFHSSRTYQSRPISRVPHA